MFNEQNIFDDFAMNLDTIDRMVSYIGNFCDPYSGISINEQDLKKIETIRTSLEAFLLSKNLDPEEIF